ncbi:FadR/GntR family transcriptional regulator [Micromonospora humi]|uniref:DNA-binding transcriptional regulator, FadR family n=1 Tax=Micromonospora humi TaxID=745366 RepID=A0A1C5JQ09_9ACTN|nr:FadR/GntR family transcriptional regulator [Micromonospora humi]SCG72573.1 DNA-binding transcriptional regulator, FadR family [Micromonospora humi]
MTARGDGFAFPPRRPAERLGVAVVSELVELIVTGQLGEGQMLPPEGPLSEHFGVSRTVVRESVKRLEEKGLVVVSQGRGTQVARVGSWNMLDPVVLSALIDNDASLGVLDELTVVRGSLEAAMAGTLATRRTPEELTRVEHALAAMREIRLETDSFRQADVVFHFTIMELSGNRLAENICKRLYRRAMESHRFHGLTYRSAFESTLDEHALVVDAIARQDAAGAERAMRDHIVTSWQRRRLEGPPG